MSFAVRSISGKMLADAMRKAYHGTYEGETLGLHDLFSPGPTSFPGPQTTGIWGTGTIRPWQSLC